MGNGAYPAFLAKALAPENKVDHIIMTDNSQACLDIASLAQGESVEPIKLERICMDEEKFSFETNTFDAIVTNLSLHWINDLPLTFVQINGALKDDCPVIGSVFGNDTLFELRTSLQLAELERSGGISPHVSPFTDSRDIGSLLGETGFQLITGIYQ